MLVEPDELNLPAVQFVQLDAPAAAQVPAPHKLQTPGDVAPVADDDVPAAHCVQLEDPAVVEYEPAAQFVQVAIDVASTAFDEVPARQSVQNPEATADQVPAPQLEQVEEPAIENCPAGQLLQVVMLVACVAAEAV